MTSGSTDQVRGLDVTALRAWLDVTLPDRDLGDLRASLIEGGRSNLTYRLVTASGVLVLRRPPLGHVLSTAHDMNREYTVMSALWPTAVPVPEPVASCTDPDVLGAPFYVMEYVAGSSYRYRDEVQALGPARARAISTEMIDTLARIHDVDVESTGLSGFGRPEGFLARQVRRWQRQLEASYSRELPDADRLHRLLSDSVPAETAYGLVHGDYRLDNLLMAGDDSCAAVVDWEMSTLGDPLTDLALLVVYSRVGRILGGDAIADASSADGFLDEREMVERYAQRSGKEPQQFGFYLGLAAFKLTGILEGIYFRHQRGETVGAGYDQIGDVAAPLLAAGVQSMKEYS